MKSVLSALAIAAALFSTSLGIVLPDRAEAGRLPRGGTATNSHTGRQGPGTYRLVVIGLGQFRTLKSGDKHGDAGELRWLRMSLYNTSAATEYETRQFLPVNLYNERTRKSAGRTLQVRRGDILHVTSYPGDLTLWANVRPGDHIVLDISAKELDCVGNRLCNRGDSGSFSLSWTIQTVVGTEGYYQLCSSPGGNGLWVRGETDIVPLRFRNAVPRAKGGLLFVPVPDNVRICLMPNS